MAVTITIGLQSTPQAKHKRVIITAETSVIGRSKECDLTINHSSLSRRHCKIYTEQNGWWIDDLGSRSGSIVDGHLLNEPIRLGERSVITCGEVLITVVNNPLAREVGDSSRSSRKIAISDGSKKHKRNAVLPRASSRLLNQQENETAIAKSSSRRQKIIRPQQGDPQPEQGKVSTAEFMVGDLNYETRELKVKSDFYDISEFQEGGH